MKKELVPTSKDWICTDPGTQQYGRQLTEFVFEFKEFSTEKGPIIINLYQGEHANTKAWVEGISGFYDNLSQVFELYGKGALWIIAECIFENSN